VPAKPRASESFGKKGLTAFAALLVACLLASAAAAQTVVHTSIFNPPGVTDNSGFNFEVAIVHSTGLVYVGTTGGYGDNVGVIDPNTNALTKTIPVPTSGPMNFALANQATGIVYFRQGSRIVVIDGRPASQTFNAALPSIVFPNTVKTFALDGTRGLLYVIVASAPERVSIVDVNPASATFHQVINQVNFAASVNPTQLAVNSVTNKIYIAAQGSAPADVGVYVLNGSNLSMTRIAATDGQTSFGVVVNESSNLVYAATFSNRLIAIDGTNDTVLTFINIPASTANRQQYDERMAVNTATGRVYVRVPDGPSNLLGKVVVVDGNRASPNFNTVLAGISIGEADFAGDIFVDEGLNRVVVTSLVNRLTYVIDGATNTVVNSIRSPQLTSDVALNPLTHKAYAASQQNIVQVIDVGGASLSATAVTAADAGTGVVNPATHLYYTGRTVAATDVTIFNQGGAAGVVTGLPHGSGRYVFMESLPALNRVYALNSAADVSGNSFSLPGFVSVIDGASNSVVANVPVGHQPFGIAANEATGKIYVLNAGFATPAPGSISVIDGATNAVTNANIAAFPVGTQFFGTAVVNETSNRFYFSHNGGGPGVGVLNGATNVATPLPASLGSVTAVEVNRNLNRVYLGTSAGTVHVLNGADDSLITTLNFGGGSVDSLAVNQTTGRVFLIDSNGGRVVAFDGNTNAFVAAVTLVGGSASALAVNEQANRLYAGSPTANVLHFFDTSGGLSHRSSLPLQFGARHLAVDAALSRVYVSSLEGAERSGVAVIDDSPGVRVTNVVSITARVTEADGVTGLAGANLILSHEGIANLAIVTTDATGAYTFANLTPGLYYSVRGFKAGTNIAPFSYFFKDLRHDAAANFRVTPPAPGPPVAITGQVTNASGVKLPDVTVTLSGVVTRTTKTDANGNYSFTNLPPSAPYTVAAQSPYYTFNPSRVFFSSNLTADRTADFTTHLDAPPVAAPTPSDTFDGPTRDAERWSLGTLTQPGLFNAAVTTAQQNGNLVITPAAGATGYNGYVSVHTFDMSNGAASVEVVQAGAGGTETIFAVGEDSNNFYRFLVRQNQTQGPAGKGAPLLRGLAADALVLSFQVKVGGVVTEASIPYDPVAHKFLRFRHEAAQNAINFETSPDAAGWTVRRSFGPLSKGVSALACELSAGTSAPTSAPGQTVFNNFQLTTSTVQFKVATARVGEGAGLVQIVVSRAGLTSGAATVGFQTAGDSASSASDFLAAFGTLKFAPGEAEKAFTVLLTDDGLQEGDESFDVLLGTPTAAGLDSPARHRVTISDNDAAGAPNPVDDPRFFSTQHYADFLNRPADQAGLDFWSNQIASCGADALCIDNRRQNVSAAFFLSPEFQDTGFYVIRIQRVAFGRKSEAEGSRILLSEFLRDARQVGEGFIDGQPGAQAVLEANRQAYAEQVVGSPAFAARFPQTTAAEYVNALFASAGVQPTEQERQEAATAYGAGGGAGRVAALRKVAESGSVRAAEFRPAFVLTQYFGYLRRDPDQLGFDFWLGKLNNHGGDYISAEMVRSFIVSGEYRGRFGN
jgi:YVTN family beta-propeller protein